MSNVSGSPLANQLNDLCERERLKLEAAEAQAALLLCKLRLMDKLRERYFKMVESDAMALHDALRRYRGTGPGDA